MISRARSSSSSQLCGQGLRAAICSAFSKSIPQTLAFNGAAVLLDFQSFRRIAVEVRIAIIGPPRAGKTTLAEELGRSRGLPILHADDLIPLGWSAASAEIARVLHTTSHLIVEGVSVVRALRKALAACSCRPCERCIILEQPRSRLSRGQLAMARGCESILREIEPELLRRGVPLERPC